MKGGYFLFNGQFHKESDTVFTAADLSQRADGFSEYFRAEHNKILFLPAIYSHLIATAESAGLDISVEIGAQGRLLQKDVSRLLNKNKLYLAARVGIQIYRTEHKINLILTSEEMERGFYPLNEPGLLLSATDQQGVVKLFSGTPSSGLHFCSIAYIIEDRIIFVGQKDVSRTCAIRDEVVRCAQEIGLETTEQYSVSAAMLLEADEVFLFDACKGVQKVLGLLERRYFSPKTRLIAERLAERARRESEE